jgi:hypothetical protein
MDFTKKKEFNLSGSASNISGESSSIAYESKIAQALDVLNFQNSKLNGGRKSSGFEQVLGKRQRE